MVLETRRGGDQLFDFKENVVDQSIHLKDNGSRFFILVVYVDDILIGSNGLGLLKETT